MTYRIHGTDAGIEYDSGEIPWDQLPQDESITFSPNEVRIFTYYGPSEMIISLEPGQPVPETGVSYYLVPVKS